MADREKIIRELVNLPTTVYCGFYQLRITHSLRDETVKLLKEQKEEHKRLLSWLSKFCRHIDNGDKWLTDEENLAFFKEKMKQQFGWDTD